MSRYLLFGYCVLVIVTIFSGCNIPFLDQQRDLQSLRADGSVTDEYIARYRNAIKKNRDELQQAIQAAGRIAHFNKLLAIQYIELGMFGLALESLKEALLVEPQNEVLFYLSGISAMQLARVYPATDSQRVKLINDSEYAFQRSIDLKDDYADPLLALSMLYIFEKEESNLASPLLQRLRNIEPSNPHVHALIGRTQVEYGNLAEAKQSYQRAAELYNEPEYHQQSLDNIVEIESLQQRFN